jgi:hypothetical protein
MRLLRQVRREMTVVAGVTMLAAQGDGALRKVLYRRGSGPTRSIEAECLFLHQGVVPNVNLASAAGCTLAWDMAQACWSPVTDAWGRTNVGSIAIAGDGAGIMGAEAAEQRGRLCGLDAAAQLGRLTDAQRDAAASGARRVLAHYARGRRYLDTAFLPDQSFRTPPQDALACRCEEITGDRIAETLSAVGEVGPNQLKAYLRCGMGPCQGRLCGATVTEIIAAQRGVPPSEVGHYRARFPVKPITLGEMASLPHTQADVRRVAR